MRQIGTHCETCDVTRVQSGMDCFGTYFTHVRSRDVTRVQSATKWTAWQSARQCPNL